MSIPIGRGGSAVVLAAGLILATGCRTYEPAPLHLESLLAEAETLRARRAGAPVATLADAMELARGSAPALRELAVEAWTAQILADIPEPLPNPTLGAGALLLSGPGVTGDTRWGAEAAVSWLIDLAGGRSAAVRTREAQAHESAVAVAVAQRTLYLEIRRAFAELDGARRRREETQGLLATAEASRSVVLRLVDAGHTSAIDVREMDVEVFSLRAEVLAAQEAEDDARAHLARLVGVDATAFEDVEIAELPPDLATRPELAAALIRGHPDLDGIRAAYEVAEADLAAEIAAQFPGLELGFSFEREEDVRKWGLVPALEVPLFDRNQHGIAVALGRRDALRERFASRLGELLGDLDAALARIRTRTARRDALLDGAEPAAAQARRLVDVALRAGAADALRVLTVARAERAVRLARRDAENALLHAWFDLEAAVGVPLVTFPSTAGDLPTLDPIPDDGERP